MSHADWEGSSAQHCFSENRRDRGSISNHAPTITEALSRNAAARVLSPSFSFCVTHITSSHVSVAKENHVATPNFKGVKGHTVLPGALKTEAMFIIGTSPTSLFN